MKEKTSMQRITRTIDFAIDFALKPVIGLGLAGLLCQPVSAQVLPHHGTATSNSTLWWITQLGLGGAGEFQINNAGNSNSALMAITNGSGSGLSAYSAKGHGVYAYTDSANGRGMWGYNRSSGVGIEGQGTSGLGVFGYTLSGPIAIYGRSDLAGSIDVDTGYPGGTGVYGVNDQTLGTGVSGEATGQGGIGVTGSGGDVGVEGSSPGGNGVRGIDNTGTFAGVEGDNF